MTHLGHHLTGTRPALRQRGASTCGVCAGSTSLVGLPLGGSPKQSEVRAQDRVPQGFAEQGHVSMTAATAAQLRRCSVDASNNDGGVFHHCRYLTSEWQ